MPAILAVAALLLAGYALLQYRVNRTRGRMLACLALALGLTYAHAVLGREPLKWASWGFLALALFFLARSRRGVAGD